MEKKELYSALQDAGVELPEYRRVTVATLQQLYDTHIAKQEPQGDAEKEPDAEGTGDRRKGNPPGLYFAGSGWCEELQCSYFMGFYMPVTWAEYDALKPYAQGGAR